jgi:Fic family protein
MQEHGDEKSDREDAIVSVPAIEMSVTTPREAVCQVFEKVNQGGVSLTVFELMVAHSRKEALEWGHFRGEGDETAYTPDVGLGAHGRYTPRPTVAGAPELNRVFQAGLNALEAHIPGLVEKALAYFLFGALQRFFFDGNKRSSRFMMNGILMSAGIDAISIPAARAQEFNEKMVQFYLTREASGMMAFLLGCHPEGSRRLP